MVTNFTAIDFETAHAKRWSICQIGLVRIENGAVADQFSSLVKPPHNFYWNRFTDIHGITPRHTERAMTFEKIWPKIEPFIKDQHVVAHNGFSFDFPCLRQTLDYYYIENPKYTGHCTYRLYLNNLASLCKEYNIALKHHDALSDALACAELFRLHLFHRSIIKNG